MPNSIIINDSIDKNLPIGRFAPSPTGRLHLGSLITAVASFCISRQVGGQWLLRIEDTDWERCRPEFSDAILFDLERLGLHWDGDVYYQSQHVTDYQEILHQQLIQVSYACDCSRKFLQQYNQQHQLTSYRYPQLCLHKKLSRQQQQIRLIMPNYDIMFVDKLQGIQCANPQQEIGDIVIQRKNGMINYMLAVVIDDAKQGVNQIIRGLDILPLTIPQLALINYLKLPCTKEYYHLPVLVNNQGQKLSKQTLAEPISPYPASKLIQLALSLLQQPNVALDRPEVMLKQAVQQWDSSPLIGQKSVSCPMLI